MSEGFYCLRLKLPLGLGLVSTSCHAHHLTTRQAMSRSLEQTQILLFSLIINLLGNKKRFRGKESCAWPLFDL